MAFAVLLGMPASAWAQFDFADARAIKIRTYPVKRDGGKVVPGPDGMPQPKGGSARRPAGLKELPALPVDADFPGASILFAYSHYQKQDLLGSLEPILGIMENGYLEFDLVKPCHIDTIKLQYEHKPNESVPSFKEEGLASLVLFFAEGAASSDLLNAYTRLKNRYNNGLSADPKADHDIMTRLQALRLAIAVRYIPRVEAPAFEGLKPLEATKRFKAEVAKGKPVVGTLLIGSLELAVKAKLDRKSRSPVPAACKKARETS